MKYDLRRPCAKCPFRSDIDPYLHRDRGWEIARSIMQGGTFPCHETTVETEDGEDMMATPDSQHCAGALVILERMHQPHQMNRIAVRLGLYDPDKLDMKSPCYEDFDAFAQAIEDAWEAQRPKRGKRRKVKYVEPVELYRWTLEWQEENGDHPTFRDAADHFGATLDQIETTVEDACDIGADTDNEDAYMGMLVGTYDGHFPKADWLIEAE